MPLRASTFDEIAMMASRHGREMVAQGDTAHIAATNEMRQSMTSPEAGQAWLAEKRKAFDALPEDQA